MICDIARSNSDSTQAPSILIVDDEESILNSLEQVISYSCKDSEIRKATSAEEALRLIYNSPADIVVTDLKLPQMNGLEFMRSIRELSPDTRSILMTAYGNGAILQEAGESGCLAYLEKPFHPDKLLEYIDLARNPKGSLRLELSDLSLADVIQLYAKNLQTAVLSVKSGDLIGLVAIRDGILTHSELNDQEGPQALLELLDCKDAEVRSICCPFPDRQSLSLTWHSLRAATEESSRETKLKLLGGEEKAFPNLLESSPSARMRAIELSKPAIEAPKTNKRPMPFALPKSIEEEAPLASPSVPAQDELKLEPLEENLSRSSRFDSFDVSHTDPKAYKDFTRDELTLHPENDSVFPENVMASEEERRQQVKNLINNGIDQFRAYRLQAAKRSWLSALQLDPDCEAAKKNLKILEKVENQRRARGLRL